MNSKCMFVLCRKCGEDFVQTECEHSDEERSLTGTWVIEEVVKALTKGYKILDVYEIWSYDSVELSKSRKGLFSDMMNRFIKLKQQASGWPRGCESDEQKNKYVEEFFQREDVRLDFSEISENPGLRSLAKLMLNSFWGKFAQRENLPKTSIIKQPNEFFAVGEPFALCQHHLVGDRAFYYDTDSIVYVAKPGLKDLPTGQCIGDLTDELGGGFISEFVSGGPKNYAYKYILPDGQQKICCKVKGISLNYAVSKTINFDKIKEMVLEKPDPVSIVTKQIQRTQDHCVITKTFEKIYKPNSTKRKFSEDFTSVPYGYKKLKI
ncbi:uncharacterized protein [Diabrotica undecimpunctata]|uniref:uncharacterized protein n=1 Tax=Diabrotica undecimpunctata TaxID=50387 RepID=UPI003B642ACF